MDLTGNKIKDSYQALFCVGLSGLTASAQQVTDGLGQGSPVYMSTSQLLFASGSAGAPVIAQETDTDTGLYFHALNGLSIVTGGAPRVIVENAQTYIENQLQVTASGSEAAPSIARTGDTNTGIYFPALDSMAIVTGGTSRVIFTSPTSTFTNQLVVTAGSVGTPSISTSGDLNTGIYFPAADTIGFVTNGTAKVLIALDGSVTVRNAANTGVNWLFDNTASNGLFTQGNQAAVAGITNFRSFGSGTGFIFDINNSTAISPGVFSIVPSGMTTQTTVAMFRLLDAGSAWSAAYMDITRGGSVFFRMSNAGAITILAPATSAGNFYFLTQNQSTGVIEKAIPVVTSGAPGATTDKMEITINGTAYYIPLTAV